MAAALVYPRDVRVGGRKLHLRNAKALERAYPDIFTPAYVAAIRDAIPHFLFVRDQGAMLGSGQVWFDGNGKVIALNP